MGLSLNCVQMRELARVVCRLLRVDSAVTT